MEKSPMKVFQEFGQGLMSGTDSWKDVVADNVSFTGPIDQVKGIEAFSDLNKAFMPLIKSTEIKQVVESGNFVITQVILDVATSAEKSIQLDMSEWYEVQNGKISSIKIYYDAEELRKEMV